LVADALSGAGEAQLYLGESAHAEETLRESERLYEDLGDARGAMNVRVNLADMLLEHGDTARARATYEEAARARRAQGDEFGIADALNRVAQTFTAEGRLERAAAVYAEALAHFQNVGEREGIANVTSNWADVLHERGEVVEAEKRYRAALALHRQVGMRRHEGADLIDLAVVLRHQGRLAESRRANHDGLAILRELADRESEADAHAEEAARLREEDDLPSAARELAAARELVSAAHNPGYAAALRVQAADLAIDLGEAGRAEPEVRGLAVELEQEGQPLALASALALEARCQIAAKHPADGLRAAEHAGQLVTGQEPLWPRVAATLALADAHSAAHACAGSSAPLEALAREAAAKHLLDVELAAELALGASERACGRTSAGPHLAEVAARARSAGFARIARLAEAGRRD
jgi:tetratricopeptide (TPR) repeat protein